MNQLKTTYLYNHHDETLGQWLLTTVIVLRINLIYKSKRLKNEQILRGMNKTLWTVFRNVLHTIILVPIIYMYPTTYSLVPWHIYVNLQVCKKITLRTYEIFRFVTSLTKLRLFSKLTIDRYSEIRSAKGLTLIYIFDK